MWVDDHILLTFTCCAQASNKIKIPMAETTGDQQEIIHYLGTYVPC